MGSKSPQKRVKLSPKLFRQGKSPIHSNASDNDNFASISESNELTRDLIHELKSFNTRMNDQIKVLMSSLDYIDVPKEDDDLRTIANTTLGLKALSDLSILRMELYEYLMSPESFEQFADQGVSIYREIEKIYKSINGGWCKEAKIFELRGESWNRFKTKRIISVGLYILLENAWKYTIPDLPIEVSFYESNNSLDLTITNWGPAIEDDEYECLIQRNYRGSNVRKLNNVSGRGLGLDIASRIFSVCGVAFSIKKPPSNKLKVINGIPYRPFCANLHFHPMAPSLIN